MSITIWGNEATDVSGELLAQALDGNFTKVAYKTPADVKNTSVIFYGAVKVPDGFKFDESYMFCDPTISRALLKRIDVLKVLKDKGLEVAEYIVLKNDYSYSHLREMLGAKFDLIAKAGMRVIATVSNSTEYNKWKGKAQYASKRLANITKKYRVFLGNTAVSSVLGTTSAEYRTLSFREALLFEACEDARTHIGNLFEEGLLTEGMGDGFQAWTEESHTTAEKFAADTNYPLFEKVAAVLSDTYGTDFCAVDFVVSNGTPIITNITTSPSLQADTVLAFTSQYFKKLLEEGRKITPEHIARLLDGAGQGQLDLVHDLLKKALAQKA